MSCGRPVPWSNAAEWQAVRRKLYARDRQTRQDGVDHVGAWSCRMRLPLAIQTTVALVEVQLDDNQDGSRGFNRQRTLALRQAYSTAIIRFVNGFADARQNGAQARSVHGIAQSLNIPTWVVDIRHEAAHTQLPSLSLLREASAEALEWLDEYYWIAQEAYLDNYSHRGLDILTSYFGTEDPGSERVQTCLDALCRLYSTTRIRELASFLLAHPDLAPHIPGPGWKRLHIALCQKFPSWGFVWLHACFLHFEQANPEHVVALLPEATWRYLPPSVTIARKVLACMLRLVSRRLDLLPAISTAAMSLIKRSKLGRVQRQHAQALFAPLDPDADMNSMRKLSLEELEAALSNVRSKSDRLLHVSHRPATAMSTDNNDGNHETAQPAWGLQHPSAAATSTDDDTGQDGVSRCAETAFSVNTTDIATSNGNLKARFEWFKTSTERSKPIGALFYSGTDH
eukprot:TRINITY_DN10201_c0_g1_i2.p1 TRINITY_DN10201_c0_g1~~TRINITY_DN10201_c0_g1_i2.p1  ORF type:complete len:455 (+),score=57.70 TRINITY_DN10201_c0_g1_i2:1357-2721(+)